MLANNFKGISMKKNQSINNVLFLFIGVTTLIGM